jgi:hypothetical protein
MTPGWIIALELLLVLGLAVGWAAKELRSLRRLRERREAEERQGPDSG